MTHDKKEQQQRGYCFHCGKYGHYKAQCRNLRRERYYATRSGNSDTNQGEASKPKNPNATPARKHIKLKTAGMEPMPPTTHGRKDAKSPSQSTKSTNNQYIPQQLSQKTKIAAPTLWGNGRREGIHNRRPPKQIRRRFHD